MNIQDVSRVTMAPRKPRAPKAAALPPRLPPGLVISDLTRRTWRLGDPIGSGGFGQIYSASAEAAGSSSSGGGGQYVIKVEAHASGPLFSEMHCYHRVARAETIDAWKKERGLKRFGMPRFVASGSFDHGGQKFRFMVIERFGTDLQKLLEQNNNRFPLPTILHIGIQVLDVLEFIHSQEYIHGDIKGQNLLLGLSKETKDLVYLVDFGLACRYASDGVHKEYKPDLRKAHNGTIEFTSRDAHIGAQSRRGDLEILGYNLLQWASGTLPWMDRLQNAERVAELKNRMMADVAVMVKACFKGGVPKGAEAIQRFLAAVAKLKFDEEPNYAALKALLQAGLKALGSPPVRLVFTADTDAPSRSGRDRSPLQPVQESAVPRRRPAAKKPGRGRPAAVTPEEGEEGEEPPALVNGVGRGGGRRQGRGQGRKRASQEAEDGEEEETGRGADAGKRQRVNGKASSARSSTVTSASTSSSIFDNINPAMQEVLDRRARVAAEKAAKGKTKTAKLKMKTAGGAARRAHAKSRPSPASSPAARKATSASARSTARRVASPRPRPAASPAENGDSEESFHTPSGTPGQRRRSGRLSGARAVVSPLAVPRRGIREQDYSPELW